jgi:excinuclease UvrABC nuclease subunit
MGEPLSGQDRAQDRRHWRVQVVQPGDDRATLERAFDRRQPSTPQERLALAWQLSVEAGLLAGWGDGEQRLP